MPAAWRDRLRQALGATKQESASDLDIEQTLALLQDDRSGDRDLAAVIAGAGNVVLPFSFGFGEPTQASPPEPPSAVAATAFRVVHGPSADRARVPLDRDQSARADSRARRPRRPASATPTPRSTGTAPRASSSRPSPTATTYYPSFALEVARQHLGVAREDVRLELGRGIRLGDRLVPTDDRTQLVVNYRGPDRFRNLSFARSAGRRRAGSRVRGQDRADRRQPPPASARPSSRPSPRSCRASNGAPRWSTTSCAAISWSAATDSVGCSISAFSSWAAW